MSLTTIAGASLGVVANAADQSNEAISPEAINLVNEITANMDTSTFYYTAYDYYDQYSVAPTNHYYGVFVPAGISLSSSFSVYMYMNTNVLSNNPTAYSKIIISPEYSSYLTLTSFTSNTYLPNCTQLTPSFARTGSPSLPAPMYSYFLDGIQNKSVINSEYDIHCMTSMYSNYPSSFVYTNKGDQLIKCVYALGDANRDGEITEDDGTCIQKYCLELAAPDPNRTATEAACDFLVFRLAADFNPNGVVDMSDAYAISQYITTHSNLLDKRPFLNGLIVIFKKGVKNMKKALSCIISAAMTLGSVTLISAAAEAETIIVDNGLEYTAVSDSVLMLTGVRDKTATSVTIPASVDGKNVIVENGIFSDCPNLKSINTDENSSDIKSIDGVLFDEGGSRLLAFPRGLKGEYTIPEGTVGIAENAFENSAGLTMINIPDSLTTIGSYAFKNCTTLMGFSKPIPLTLTGEALYGCTALKSIELARSSELKYIGAFKFENCPNLETLIIPNNYILTSSFNINNCPKLKNVVLPDRSNDLLLTVTNCAQLDSLILPTSGDNGKGFYSHATISKCPSITELNISNAQKVSVKDMDSLEIIKLTISPYGSIDEINNNIDYATCPKLKDIYIYNADIQPNAKEIELMAANDITLHCRKTEKWSSYLDSHKVKYVFIDDEIIYGDVNIDGTVNMSDAVLIMQALSNPNKYSLTEEQKKRADVSGNSDGMTNLDALGIQQYLLKLVTELPIK